MKKLHSLTFTALLILTGFLSSCSYEPEPNNTPTAKMNFKKGFLAQYDIFVVDTADKNGSNPDHRLDNTRINVQEKVIDTALTYPTTGTVSKSNVAQVTTFTVNETNYFSQDANGDLYRYNFGFSILNQFSALTNAIGSNVDVGWVLAAKMTSAVGTTWIAKRDTIIITNLGGIPVYLESKGEMMADTTFLVGTSSIKARHSRNTVTATAALNQENAVVILDSYYSTDINAVVCDFFHNVTLTGNLLNQHAQGKYKIMTSYTP